MARRLALIAVGGNSLTPAEDARGNAAGPVSNQSRAVKAPSDEISLEALERTVESIATLAEDGWRIVITHGNGPQVGFNLLRVEAAAGVAPALGLDTLVAQTQGSIGYRIQQVLRTILRRRRVHRSVGTVITQVVVDPRDPAFARPTKPIGPFYSREEAADKMKRGWRLVEDAGRGWRRVVPSPEPREVVEQDIIRTLVDAGVVVIAAGGGGIPVIRRNGRLEGCEAVIDKDLTSALLASGLGADLLVISTAVEQVALDYGKPGERPLPLMTLKEARTYLQSGQFAPGSMGPKIQAAVRFLERGGREVLITSPEALRRAVRGKAGTRIISQLKRTGHRSAKSLR